MLAQKSRHGFILVSLLGHVLPHSSAPLAQLSHRSRTGDCGPRRDSVTVRISSGGSPIAPRRADPSPDTGASIIDDGERETGTLTGDQNPNVL